MNLYLNTSGEQCEIAIFSDNKIIAHRIHAEPMQHSTVLHTMIQDLLLEAKITFKDLKSISVLNGPGSYTGLRIGLAAAKGFCYALDIPLILFNKLALSCSFYLSQHPQTNTIACLEPARKEEYFFIIMNQAETLCQANVQTTNYIFSELEKYNEIKLISSKAITIENIPPISEISIPIEFIATKTKERMMATSFNDLFTSQPFYLKKVHANLPNKRF